MDEIAHRKSSLVPFVFNFRGIHFVSSPPERIYTLDENKFRENYLYYWNWKPTHPRNQVPTNMQNTHDPRKLAPSNLNDTKCSLENHKQFECISKTFLKFPKHNVKTVWYRPIKFVFVSNFLDGLMLPTKC